MHIEVPALAYNDLANKDGGERSAQIAQRVHTTRRRQLDRFQGEPFCNAHMASQHLRNHCLTRCPGPQTTSQWAPALGLYIIVQLMEPYAVEINVDSKIDFGTTFRLHIPLTHLPETPTP